MPLGRCLAIVNPAAKHGVTGRMLPAVQELMSGVAECEYVASEGPVHAREVARDARGFDTFLAVGGDGTVHEVVNGIMDRPEGERPAFSVVPTGSGNDYARTLGISFDLPTAIRQIARAPHRRVDLGVCNGVYFANSMAVGLDARVTAKAVETKARTGWSGLPVYLRSLFFVLFRQFYAHPLLLEFDDNPPQDTVLLAAAITIGRTYGGGFRITPDAIPDDGLLDVCLIDSISLPGALWRLPFVILGKHAGMKPVHMSRHTRVVLRSDVPVEGQIDGEVVLFDRYDVHILPGELEVIAPKLPQLEEPTASKEGV